MRHRRDTTDKFVVMETTNGIYNKELFELIQPKCVLMWQRVQVRGEGWIGKGGSSGQRPITSLARLLRRVLVASVLLCLHFGFGEATPLPYKLLVLRCEAGL